MERETKEVITPVDKRKVVIKTYLTGREYREIENVFLKQAKVNTAGQQSGEFDGSIVKVAEDRLIEQAVVSIDGKAENILNSVLDFKQGDFAFLVKELNEMKYGEIEGKKKLP